MVFISAEKDAAFPSVEGTAEGRFLLDNPKSVIVTPPGVGLVEEIEQKIQINVTKVELKELCEVLPQVILDNFTNYTNTHPKKHEPPSSRKKTALVQSAFNETSIFTR